MRIEGLSSLQQRLASMAKLGQSSSVVVGFGTNYGLFVHEDLTALHGAAWNAAYIDTSSVTVKKGKNAGQVRSKHEWTPLAVKMGYHMNASGNAKRPVPKNPNQQAKFLEQPARIFAKEIGDIVREAVRRGKTLAQALLLGGLFLQRKSQEIVPVDTGNLRASAFTRLEQ